ncbi:hypothetical protein IQ37_02355 [Chryseobacterium piperi]|uniref:Peptidase n=1 Tax=Chryseobacterium piperi TaxID=558152 RepID=A0A086BM61_9FLAO|nr:PepSY-associated TM helix domain-containing protein [Chryseobacterium piperi]KFF30025.1 hypothetical protein IQ37_02355 [Chryseobacterium piperi]
MRKQSFSVKWDAKIKRQNYDLHNVFGFYALIILLVVAMTGMYDQNTGARLSNTSAYAAPFERVDFATKVQKLNYDLHVGSARGGIWGRVLYFFITIIGASLPITGFLV